MSGELCNNAKLTISHRGEWGWLYLLLCGWFLLAAQGWAAQPVLDVAQMQHEAVALNEYFSVMEDAGASLTLADVTQPEFAERFKAISANGNSLGFSYTRSAIWLRFQLKNSSNEPVERVLEIAYALLANVDLYQPSGGGYRYIEAGYARPLSPHAHQSRFIAVPIQLPAGADQQLYLRVQTPNSMVVPARLWLEDAFHSYQASDYSIQAFYFGIALAIIVYNLLLYFGLRDDGYLLYVVFACNVALALGTFTGMGREFIWGVTPVWTKIGVTVPAAFASVVMLQFTRRMLKTQEFVPGLDQWLKLFIGINFVSFFLLILWFQDFVRIFVVLNILTSLMILVTGIVLGLKRQRSGYYFAAAFSLLAVANVLSHFRNLGILPSNLLTTDSLQIGSTLEMLVLSLVLADRVNMMRREKIAAQAEALQLQGEMVNRLKASEQSLETRVATRTQQLETSLATLQLREAELVLARDAAETANETKSRFLATMSHEIRTPMNGILGMAQALLLPNIEPRKRVDYVSTIVKSGQVLLTLLNDLLDLSRVEAGNLQLENIAFDPAVLITETKALFSEQAQSAGLTIECIWKGSHDDRFLGDPMRLRQMLSNLVANAIKFTKQGHIRIEAHEISHDDRGALLEFAVCDTGMGVDPDKLPLLFQSFSQADASIARRYGGSGLGLSIVRNLAELMGGEVGVHSVPAQGSRFWFRVLLPCRFQGLSTQPKEFKAELLQSAEAPVPIQFRGRVLVAEDNLVSQDVVQALLDAHGLQVTVAANGQHAADAITTGQPFDLVLLDLQMPVMDGLTTAARIRDWEAQTGSPRLPIVAITANAFKAEHQPGRDTGIDQVLTKPIALEAMQAMLMRWLPQKQLCAVDSDAALGPITKLIDVARVRALVAEIMPLLMHNKFAAIACFRKLQDELEGTELAPDLAQTGGLLKEFRFDLVRQRLRHMVSEQGWGEDGHG